MFWFRLEKIPLQNIPIGLAISQCFGKMDKSEIEKVDVYICKYIKWKINILRMYYSVQI